jgi:hypothetical protein
MSFTEEVIHAQSATERGSVLLFIIAYGSRNDGSNEKNTGYCNAGFPKMRARN